MNDWIERMDPGFVEPIWLGVGALALLAVILLEMGSARRRRQAIGQFAASHLASVLTASVSGPKRWLKRLLLLAAIAFLFLALARPYLFSGWRDETRTGLDILLAVDCSRSMVTEDVRPNRLERAKLAIADFSDHLPDNRLGLIAFAGDAFLQCPLTLDHDAFNSAVRELDLDTIPRPGTDIATAIQQASLALKSQPNNMKFLILVTDGEDLEARGIDAAREAAQTGLKIFTVGVGTPSGGLIPQRDDSGAIAYLHDSSGQIVQSKLDESTLRQIAEATGGAYLPLGQNGEGLEQIYHQYIEPLPKQKLEERREKIRYERFVWPLAVAIFLLMLEFFINERAPGSLLPPSLPSRKAGIVRRPSSRGVTVVSRIAMAGFFFLAASSAMAASSAAKAEREYKAGQYSDALQNYKDASTAAPNRTDLKYDTGDAAYKAGAYTDAEDAYRQTLETPDLGLQENTYYNLGNTQFKHGEALQKVDPKKTIDMWEHALTSYTSALKLKEAADTRHNYEVVKKKLEQLKQQQQQKNQQGGDGQSNDPQPSQDGKKSDKGNSPGQQEPGKNHDNSGDQAQSDQKSADKGKDKQQDPTHNDKADAQQQAYSQGRQQDKDDPGAKSRQEAEALLDSLKDDERHVSARALDGNNGETPPPPSGKDW